MSKSKIKCDHCRKLGDPAEMLNGQYCNRCVRLYCDRIIEREGPGEHLRNSRECIIPGCTNRTDEGKFVRDLCSPCHSYVVLNKGRHSQAYRNELFKARLRDVGDIFAAYPGLVRISWTLLRSAS